MHDVFVIGDSWFRTGDLMRRDAEGYFYFIDRIGDSFRWKGENVATGEVDDAIRDCTGVIDAVTYGVFVPGTDGRAGIAAMVINDRFDFNAFADHLAGRLPSYAHPIFLRDQTYARYHRNLQADKTSVDSRGIHPLWESRFYTGTRSPVGIVRSMRSAFPKSQLARSAFRSIQ